jgi:hypothetical protein
MFCTKIPPDKIVDKKRTREEAISAVQVFLLVFNPANQNGKKNLSGL